MNSNSPEDKFKIFGRIGCVYCSKAKEALETRSIPFDFINMQQEGISKSDIAKQIGKPVNTVPQIFYGQHHIGGYTELAQYLENNM
jgi:glutaredoxin 1